MILDLFRLDGQTAIVTGAGKGIGRAIALAFADAGANVVAAARTQADIDDTANEVVKRGRRALAVKCDVMQREDLENVVARALAEFGRIDTLVNNAGRWRRTLVTDPWEKALADWDFIMDTNLRGLLLLSRACVPQLVAAGGGDIVHVSTYYVLPAKSTGTNSPETDLYNASKWALNGFTEAWARVLAPKRVRVNALCMGACDTPMLRGLWEGDPPADFAASWMKPAQIAQQLLDLLGEGPSGRTGQNIGAWVGEPVVLPPPYPPHRAVTG